MAKPLQHSGPTPVERKRDWLLNRGGLLKCVHSEFPIFGSMATDVSNAYLVTLDDWLRELIDVSLTVTDQAIMPSSA
jgi:hypothetical protein